MRTRTKSTRPFSVLISATIVALASSHVAGAQVPFELVHRFSVDSAYSPNALIQAADGHLYGTSFGGGVFGGGTIFKMTRSGTVTVLHDFSGCYPGEWCPGGDGRFPASALIQATDGNFYGTTTTGGAGGEGTVFRMTPNGVVTVLHSFACHVDGCFPYAPLIQAADGNLYGTVIRGASLATGWGKLFKVGLDGAFAILHGFSDSDPAGYSPSGNALLQTADGNFYGSTNAGGALGFGTIFRMAPDGSVTVVHTCSPDVDGQPGAFVEGADGNLYGTLVYSAGHHGAVFKMTPAGSLTVLHQFTGMNGDGVAPTRGLVRATAGTFYGTTAYGGDGPDASSHGTVFRLASDGTVSTLYAFTDGADAAHPGTLVLANDGSLYGTADNSSVFRMTTAGSLTTLGNVFPGIGEGSASEASLIEGADGNLYGTTSKGGRNYLGTVFRVTHGGVTAVVHSFTAADGATPHAALVQGVDGSFYGTTGAGGASNLGTVFRMTSDGALTVLHAFSGGTDGARPYGSVVRGPDGAVYGTTRDGGPLDFGTVFRVTPNGSYTVLYSFAGGYDGGHPLAALVLGTDGNFYGTTSITGAFNAGTAFRITSQGRLTILHAFSGTDGTGRDGSYPQAALLQADDRNFYGTTYAGGTFGYGTMFRMTADGAITILHSFTRADGANPIAALIQGHDGNFYGTASDGGSGEDYPSGTVFRSTPTGTVTVIRSFNGTSYDCGGCDGFYPHAALLQAHDGHMYATASQGGYGGGTVFRLRFGPDLPSRVRATATADGHVQLRWSAAQNATSYTVRRALTSGQESVLAAGLTAPMFADGFTTKGRRYYYVVSAVNGFGESVASYEVSITPGRAIAGDFDGDSKSDTTVFRPSTGIWYARESSTGTGAFYQWGLSGDIPVPGDYDGDGKTDVAVFRPSTGIWYVRQSSTGTGAYYQWGLDDDVPVPGDYDGDGKTDVAVFRPSTGIWYVLQSSTGMGAFYQWGLGSDMPVPGDYDGDGKTDVAVFRPSTGIWYVLQSSTGTGAFYQWGLSGDLPVPGDYDGDGKTDVAVFRPSTGIWYVLQSSTATGAFYQWGLNDDVAVPGDYDGDGQTDVAVFRPSTGIWYVLQSSTGTGAFYQWGLTGDLPILKAP